MFLQHQESSTTEKDPEPKCTIPRLPIFHLGHCSSLPIIGSVELVLHVIEMSSS